MPRKRSFKCTECSRSFILQESFNDHNVIGIHEPIKQRCKKRKTLEELNESAIVKAATIAKTQLSRAEKFKSEVRN